MCRVQGEAEALVVKSLLEANDIPVLLERHIVPSVHPFTLDGLGEVRVLVPAEDEEASRELLRGK